MGQDGTQGVAGGNRECGSRVLMDARCCEFSRGFQGCSTGREWVRQGKGTPVQWHRGDRVSQVLHFSGKKLKTWVPPWWEHLSGWELIAMGWKLKAIGD